MSKKWFLENGSSILFTDDNNTNGIEMELININEDSVFIITKDEAKALNFFLRLHVGLLRQNSEQYEQILRLINGLGTFLDKNK